MRIKTILDHVHPLKGFVSFRVARSRNALHVTVEARKRSKGRCGGCGKAGPTCDTSRQPRHFGFVPLWGMAVFLLYAMRRIDCPTCGVVTEAVPWADGKRRACRAKAVAAGPGSGQRSAEGFPCLAAEPALNVAVTDQGDELDAEAALDGAAGAAQRPADAAGELMAALDAEADEDPEEGA